MYKLAIIDDNELTRKSIAKAINKQLDNCMVIADAADGREGLHKILSLVPDIIISDIKMPGLDGLSMVRTLRASLPLVQVIFITGYQDFQYAHTAIELHTCAFLLKPVRDSQLVEAVHQAIKEIQKNSPSLLNEIDHLIPIIEHGTSNELEQKLSALYDKADYFKEENSSLLKTCFQQVSGIILHHYWKRFPEKIDLEKETCMLYSTESPPSTKSGWIHNLLAYQDRLKKTSLNMLPPYSLMISKVLQYIGNHYKDDISLTGIAAHFMINPSYLSSLIKKETGKTFTDLVLLERLNCAKKLLSDPRYRINEVSEQSGFHDYTYFYQIFKKHEGVSPKKYRNNPR